MLTSIFVGARSSPLSQVQFIEVQKEFFLFHPKIQLIPIWHETTGDKDLKTSLRSLEKTDFFTRELDMALLEGKCRLAIHSAKDLPDPLPKGLKIIAITKGLTSADVLVFRASDTLYTLPPKSLICTSSLRREENVRKLRSDFLFADLRGTIGERLDKLNTGKADGVVVAEAALIRLNLTHLNRIELPGPTTPLQGKLALVAKEEDYEIEKLFTALNEKNSSHVQ